MVGSSRDPYESRVRTHGTPTWRKRNHSRASSFHLPPSSFLPTPRRIEARLTIEERNQGNGGEKERRCKYPGEFISRRDYQTGADTRIPSSHNSRPSRRSRLRGCVYIRTYVHVASLSVKGISRSAYLCVRAPATIRQGYIGGQTSARVTGGDLCLRYAVRQGDRSQRGTTERESETELALETKEEIEGGRKTERNRSISLFCLLTGIPSTRTSERTNERATDRTNGRVVGRGAWSGERGEARGLTWQTEN